MIQKRKISKLAMIVSVMLLLSITINLTDMITVEAASNKSWNNAKSVGLNKWGTFKGFIEWPSDEFYYKVKTSSRKDSRYTLYANILDNTSTADVELYNSRLDRVTKLSCGGFYGPKEYESKLKLKSSATYYICVSGMYSDEYSKVKFKLKENICKPTKPSFSSAKAGRNNITLKWRSYKASRFQIKKRVSGGSWGKAKTIKASHYTFSKLKNNRKYQIKVRGQRRVEGKWYSGKWAKITKTTK